MFAELRDMAGGVGGFQIVLGGSLGSEYAIGRCLAVRCGVHGNTLDGLRTRILPFRSRRGVCRKDVQQENYQQCLQQMKHGCGGGAVACRRNRGLV